MKHFDFLNRQDWLKNRQVTIGASDVPVILGLSKYKSPYTLWAEKTGRIPLPEQSLAAEIGQYMEAKISELYERETGKEMYNSGDYCVFYHESYPWFCCTPDRLIVDSECNFVHVVELKTIGENVYRQLKDGNPPLAYLVQLQAQMMILGVKTGSLACLIGNNKFEIFEFELHENICEKIIKKVKSFYECVVNGTEPAIDDSISTYDTLAILHPNDNGETVQIDQKIESDILLIKTLQEKIKEIEAQIQACKNRIVYEMGDNTFAVGTHASASYKTEERKGSIKVHLDKLAEIENSMERVFYKVTEPSTRRVLRIKTATEKE